MALKVPYLLQRLAMEPPFRVAARALLRRVKTSSEARALWDLSLRPAYLVGLVAAAEQARAQGISEISVIEFGVAGGNGLVAMQDEAATVEAEYGIGVRVFGFDMGSAGLPALIGDYRDHPDQWKQGDYPMDVDALRARLTDRTTLVLGNIAETAAGFFEQHLPPPVGFVAIDLDLYSSTRDALRIFRSPVRRMLWHTPMYFDDIGSMFTHRYAGELLAIHEFNVQSETVKIDRWYGVRTGRPFPERPYLDRMFVAHDIATASGAQLDRQVGQLALSSRRTFGVGHVRPE